MNAHDTTKIVSKGLLNIKEVAQYTGIAESTLYKWKTQGKIPHKKLGGSLKFDLGELDEWIKQQTVIPKPERPLDK